GAYLVWLATSFLPIDVSAIAVVVFMIILNRGFHLDGLADGADALLSHKSHEEKLAIMKDSHQGTFGVLAIVLNVLLKTQLISALLLIAPQLLIIWPVAGRLTASVVAVRSEYIRSEGGLGRYMVEGSTHRDLFYAALFSLIVGLFFGFLGVAAMVFAAFVGFFLTWFWRKILGGITGDLLGASIELSEVFVLLLLVSII
ncbi:MAG: adenosylcobinamide-GDP ribazoletransferase, partial [Candidatus Adiutrix sp.]